MQRRRRNPRLERDARAGQRAHHLADGLDVGDGVEHLRLQGLAAREGEELAGELGAPVGRVRDGLDVAAAPLVRQVGAAELVDRGADDGQQVIEVMGDAAGQLADGLHLLGLA